MPAVFDSLVQKQGLTHHQAWRVAYIVPFIIITAVALGMLFTCDDTPTGKWSERLQPAVLDDVVLGKPENPGSPGPSSSSSSTEKKSLHDTEAQAVVIADNDSTQPQRGHSEVIDKETIIPPTLSEATQVMFNLSTFSLAATYACTFGAELALDSILGSYYSANFPHLGQTESGKWAAMFGLLNVIFRPLGGYISDLLYMRFTQRSVWAKKLWQTFLGVVTGAFLIAIGLDNPKSQATMFGLSAGLAFFLEAANGANFAVVPHVFPFANGEHASSPFF
jgi:NNP family nitrate/nitrite transporter-like MFS transporter